MARSFAGGVSTDRVNTSLTTNSDLRTYSIWTYRIGDGGGGFGRIWHKGNVSASTLDTAFNTTATTYDYNRRFSVSNGIWSFTRPAINEWHHIFITHDMSSDANDPTIYLDGVLQSPTETQTPSGTRADNTQGYYLGNREQSDRAWEGYLAEFTVWARILSESERIGMVNGNHAWRYPASLMSYVTLREDTLTDFVGSAATATGTTIAPDPPWHRAVGQKSLRPAIFKPGIAR